MTREHNLTPPLRQPTDQYVNHHHANITYHPHHHPKHQYHHHHHHHNFSTSVLPRLHAHLAVQAASRCASLTSSPASSPQFVIDISPLGPISPRCLRPSASSSSDARTAHHNITTVLSLSRPARHAAAILSRRPRAHTGASCCQARRQVMARQRPARRAPAGCLAS
jgi:hypothetical protein